MATAREHLTSVLQLTAELLELDDATLEAVYTEVQEADDAITDALSEVGR